MCPTLAGAPEPNGEFSQLPLVQRSRFDVQINVQTLSVVQLYAKHSHQILQALHPSTMSILQECNWKDLFDVSSATLPAAAVTRMASMSLKDLDRAAYIGVFEWRELAYDVLVAAVGAVPSRILTHFKEYICDHAAHLDSVADSFEFPPDVRVNRTGKRVLGIALNVTVTECGRMAGEEWLQLLLSPVIELIRQYNEPRLAALAKPRGAGNEPVSATLSQTRAVLRAICDIADPVTKESSGSGQAKASAIGNSIITSQSTAVAGPSHTPSTNIVAGSSGLPSTSGRQIAARPRRLLPLMHRIGPHTSENSPPVSALPTETTLGRSLLERIDR
ncbi:hypothetical protein B0H16DRAFT_1556159 [Mycena metata]|uniref:Uncharacterized protein n=1 Tax=Mycena metata TaxID=1033252 RepID=A0AAD7N613_9AGAR|nr:hypothetical protein B0H16DRAFT_1556120 [Mycena metata]KAJ7747062.1 hypothetical protein B0H16DRAFT_1556159 [Mycena metata]